MKTGKAGWANAVADWFARMAVAQVRRGLTEGQWDSLAAHLAKKGGQQ